MHWIEAWRQGRAVRLMSGLLLIHAILSLWGIYQSWQYLLERQALQQTQRYQAQLRQRHRDAMDRLEPDFGATLIAQGTEWIGFRLEHTLPLSDWQDMLQILQQQFWLTPIAVDWQRTQGQWHGVLTWHFSQPTTLKPQLNVLPLPLKIEPPRQGVLVSTVQGKHAAALIKVNQQEVWLHRGHWSPQLRATLARVTPKDVILNDQIGRSHTLSFSDASSREAP